MLIPVRREVDSLRNYLMATVGADSAAAPLAVAGVKTVTRAVPALS
jgi:hypothetical protein